MKHPVMQFILRSVLPKEVKTKSEWMKRIAKESKLNPRHNQSRTIYALIDMYVKGEIEIPEEYFEK